DVCSSDLAQHEATEASRIDRRFQRFRAVAEARLEDRSDQYAGFFGGRENFVRAFQCRVDRLLDHQVLAGTDGREGRLAVPRARRGDGDGGDLRVLRELFRGRRDDGDVVLLREAARILDVAARCADELCSFDRLSGTRVKRRDRAGADDAGTNGVHWRRSEGFASMSAIVVWISTG